MRYKAPLPSLFVMAVILTAVLLPGSSLPDNPGIPGLDKIVHFLMFFGLAAAIHLDFDITGRKKFAYSIGFGLLFAVATEFLQILVDGRVSEMLDAIADCSGFLFGLWFRKGLAKTLVRPADMIMAFLCIQK